MITIKCNQPVFCDVDDTLVMWGYDSVPSEGLIEVKCHGYTHYVKPHLAHVQQLKAHAAKGHTVIIWSQGGSEWATAAVNALGLREFVTLVIEKPHWMYDDLPAEAFMPKSKFIKEKEV